MPIDRPRPFRQRRPFLSRNLMLAALLLAPGGTLTLSADPPGATTSALGAVTPPTLDPGAPAGSYSLSGFEDINLYSGHLNVTIPLLNVGGRGEAGYTMTLPISQPSPVREVESTWIPQPPPQVNGGYFVYGTFVSLNWWTTLQQGYGPGMVIRRSVGDSPITCPDGGSFYQQIQTTIVFRAPDGNEHTLYSHDYPNAMAHNYCGVTDNNPFSRGTLFQARDGSGIAFYASAAVIDNGDVTYYQGGHWETSDQSGVMVFPNGVRYTISGSLITAITDRNGNTITLSSVAGSTTLSQVTDALGRNYTFGTLTSGATEAQCANSDPVNHPVYCDQINYPGADGATRQIIVVRKLLSDVLRGQTPAPQAAGAELPAAVRLPNGAHYSFQYNSWGEVARVDLPTGGAIEYDHGPGVAPDPANGASLDGLLLSDVNGQVDPGLLNSGWKPAIYRRLLERRVYANGGSSALGTTPTSTTDYRPFESVDTAHVTRIQNNTVVTNIQILTQPYLTTIVSAPNQPSVETHHYFHGSGYYSGASAGGIDGMASPATRLLYSTGGIGYGVDGFEGKEYKTETLAAQGGSVLQRSQRVFQQTTGPLSDGSVLPCQENVTTIDGTGLASVTGGKFFAYGDYNNPTDTYEYGYGNAPVIAPAGTPAFYSCASPGTGWVRHTSTTYLSDAAYVGSVTAPGAFVRSLPASTVVTTPGGTTVAETRYFYDSTYDTTSGTGCSNGDWSSLNDAGAVTGHLASYGLGSIARGNATCAARRIDASHWAATKTKYDTVGRPYKAWDAVSSNPAATYAYADNCGYGLMSAVTNALGRNTNVGYSCGVAKPSLITDVANNRTTTLGYGDPLDRLTSAVEAGVRHTTHTYSASPLTVESATEGVNREILYDGMGRQTAVIVCGGGPCSGGAAVVSRVDTQYDGMGRVWKVSNPSTTATDCAATPGNCTVTLYDALGRVQSVTRPDGSQATTVYGVSTSNPAALWAKATEAGKSRTTYSDAQGRLIQVSEDPDGVNYVTTYGYNAADQLTSVAQGGQSRSFSYDLLNRLTAAMNPETGTISYTYDANGNLLTRSDARTAPAATMTSSYDVLNRLQTRNYSNAVGTPAVNYCYDGQVYSNGACVAGSAVNETGYLTGVGNSKSSTQYRHQALGLVRWSQQSTNSTQFPTGKTYTFETDAVTHGDGYVYDAGGRLTDVWYPSGRHLTYGYDAAERVNSIAGYVSQVGYEASGAVNQMSFGNQLVEQSCYNSRLQVTAIRLGGQSSSNCVSLTGDVAGFAYDYGTAAINNGNVYGQTITAPKTAGGTLTLVQRYLYDGLNRLGGKVGGAQQNSVTETANGGSVQWWMQDGYDPWGNRSVTASFPENLSAPSAQSQLSAATNRIVNRSNGTAMPGDAYDAAGNLHDHPDVGVMSYDAENRLVGYQVSGQSSVVTTYDYDGEGRRVRKFTGTAETVYVYDAGGQLTAEYGSSGSAVPGRQYVTVDALGSTRVVTDTQGNAVSRFDYFPFGENIPGTAAFGGRDSVGGYGAAGGTIEFTGQVRDGESGLDYFGARYFSSAQGRFTSPDQPFADQDAGDPQSWNLYSYTRNNPLRFMDPTGRKCVQTSNGQADDGTGGGCAAAGVDTNGNIQAQQVNVTSKPATPEERREALFGPPLFSQKWRDAIFGPPGISLGMIPVGPPESAAGNLLAKTAEAAEEANAVARIINILRTALKGKGNFGLGSGTAAEADAAGKAWVGEGAKVASDGTTLVSGDGLRQYRPPSFKPNLGTTQANFESRPQPSAQWQSNGHLDVK